MDEWNTDEQIEGLRSFSGTDTRERFYESCADSIVRLRSALEHISSHFGSAETCREIARKALKQSEKE